MLPVSVLADDVAAAILRSKEQGVFVNGSPAIPSAAVFANDFIETQKQAIARIEVTGSAANIDPETILQFQDQELVLDHGSLSVFTGRGLRVRAGCVTVTPVDPASETTYEVLDREGKVVIHATKSDVYIDVRSRRLQQAKNPQHSSRETVREGEQKTHAEACAASALNGPAKSADGALLNSPWAVAAGAAAIGGLVVWVLCKNDDPLSPHTPANSCPIP